MTAPFPPEGTMLVLSVGGVPLYSARDLEQTLEPIDQASVIAPHHQRHLGRSLGHQIPQVPVRDSMHRRRSARARRGVSRQTLTVDCVAELVYQHRGGTPSRPVIAGSARTVGDYTIYRPRLDMMVIEVQQRLSEYESRGALGC